MENVFWLNPIEYIRKHDRNAPSIETTVRRFLAKPDGFSINGTRATKSELANFEEWLKTKSLPHLTWEQWQTRLDDVLTQSELTKTQQRSYRCYATRFINHLGDLGYLLVLTPPEPSSVSTKNLIIKRKKPDFVVEKSQHNRPKPKQIQQRKIILSFTATDYLEVYQSLYPELTEAARLTIIQNELDRLDKQLKEFQNYLAKRTKDPLRLATQEKTLEHIKRLLGWRFNRTQNLALITLESLIPMVDKRVSLHNFQSLQAYYEAKGRLDAEAEKTAEDVVSFLLDFFDNYGHLYARETKLFYINALLNLAKFLYQRITCKTKSPNYQDIEVICALHAFSVELSKEPPKFKELPLTLKDVRTVLETYKQHIDDPACFHKQSNGKFCKEKRPIKFTAGDLQRLVMLGLISVVPPLRRRTLGQLEFGRTLVHGIETESGFIPKDKMPNPSEALYYYDMLPDDYKTGKTYGNYFVVLPNYYFQDGSCFYDYLDKWLYEGYRQELLEHGQTHQYLFVRVYANKKGDLKGDPLPYESYTNIIAQLTQKFTGIKIRPQIFRVIYRTHYVNIGAPPDVLDALAFFMQHSPETAAKVYTRRSLSEKLAPFQRFHLERDL
jgi:hypothetical protein